MIGRIGVAVCSLCVASNVYAAGRLHHELHVTLQPEAHRLTVQDTITLPSGLAHGKTLRFSLHSGLAPRVLNDKATLEPVAPKTGKVPVVHTGYLLTLAPGAREIRLEYGGEIFHALSDESAELARGMRESAGIIAAEGVFLDGASAWYPHFEADAGLGTDELVDFAIEARLPKAWDAVSQGARTRHELDGDIRVVRWEEQHPQDEIYLLAAPFTEYMQAGDGVQAMVFLRTPDESLARTYLDATVRYTNMYSQLLGAYPYAKFALVENFWETGFGMPSFTLLGSKVLRLPFIVNSSYPHEILHNWWGNGVYVDYTHGNWSEGLTSYLADHLLQEQRGEGANYRRAALQKYTDFVSTARDFPLTEFRSRHSSTTEAVGYGKTLLLFHMLRRELGDEIFIQGLREFYRRFQFKSAGFDDVKIVLAEVAKKNLDASFDAWVKRPGAPQLRVREVHAKPDGDGFMLGAVVEQAQPGAAFPLNVPLAVHMRGIETAYQTTLRMNDKRLELSLRVPSRPLRLDVDPEFDIFRRLDRAEIPPALSQVFGAEKVLLLIPSAAPAPLRQAYEQLAQIWRAAEPDKIEIKADDALKALPKDRAVWLFGWENRWRAQLADGLKGYALKADNDGVLLNGQRYARADQALVVSARSPVNAAVSLAWLASDNPQALAALARKLPHYARYSFLAFQNADASNTLKGQWPVVGSPLSAAVRQDDGEKVQIAAGKLASRAALVPAAP